MLDNLGKCPACNSVHIIETIMNKDGKEIPICKCKECGWCGSKEKLI